MKKPIAAGVLALALTSQACGLVDNSMDMSAMTRQTRPSVNANVVTLNCDDTDWMQDNLESLDAVYEMERRESFPIVAAPFIQKKINDLISKRKFIARQRLYKISRQCRQDARRIMMFSVGGQLTTDFLWLYNWLFDLAQKTERPIINQIMAAGAMPFAGNTVASACDMRDITGRALRTVEWINDEAGYATISVNEALKIHRDNLYHWTGLCAVQAAALEQRPLSKEEGKK